MISKNNPLVAEHHQDNKIYQFKYWDVDSFDDLELEKIRQVYAVCFYQGKIYIVLNGALNKWGLVGGTREQGETVEETLIREVKEESNTKVLSWKPIGVQQVIEEDGSTYYQLRVMCVVEPMGDFLADPAGSVTEIKLINPKEYRNYFDWGEIGENIIPRAISFI